MESSVESTWFSVQTQQRLNKQQLSHLLPSGLDGGALNEEVLPILGAESAKIFSAKILGP